MKKRHNILYTIDKKGITTEVITYLLFDNI